MRLKPIPGAANDVFESRVLSLPFQFAFNFFGARNKNRRVAGTARHFFRWNRMPRDFACSLDDFADAEAAAIAQVVDEFVLFAERIEREDMGAGQIGEGNVVADAGSVRSFVVGAE